jgi:hypothetical protein
LEEDNPSILQMAELWIGIGRDGPKLHLDSAFNNPLLLKLKVTVKNSGSDLKTRACHWHRLLGWTAN